MPASPPHQAAEGGPVRERAQVHDLAAAAFVRGCRGFAREVALGVGEQRGRPGQVDDVLPETAGRAGFGRVQAVEGDGHPLGQRRQFLHAQAEQIAPGGRVAAEPHPVGRVDDPGEERDQGGAAAFDEPAHVPGTGVGDQVERGDDHEPVAGQVALGVGEVDADAGVQQRAVELADQLGLAQPAGRVRVKLQRPPALPVEQQRGLRVHQAASDRGQPAQACAQAHHVAPDPAVGPGVRQHPAVELLGPGGSRAPLERQHRVAAARHRLQAERAVLARRLGHVDAPPVHRARGLLHQDPGPPAADGAGQVVGHGGGHVRLGVGRVGVAVHGHHVELGGPPELVHGPEQPHEVRGDRRARAVRREHVALGAVAGQQLVGAEPGEVELLRRVAEGGCRAWRLDLVPARVVLAPDRAAPCLVQPSDLPVARLEPAPERGRGLLAVAGRHVAAVFVADVPHGHGRMTSVT